MKKVRKADLVNLIAQLYSDFIRPMRVWEIAEGNEGVKIDVNPICIYVIDHHMFESASDQEIRIQKFAEQIEAITFGNLKVTYKGCKVGSTINCLSWMYIANAYEVVE